jgi:hypothetical protein
LKIHFRLFPKFTKSIGQTADSFANYKEVPASKEVSAEFKSDAASQSSEQHPETPQSDSFFSPDELYDKYSAENISLPQIKSVTPPKETSGEKQKVNGAKDALNVEAAADQTKLEELVDETFMREPKTHTHAYTGDRLWKDEKCPICRIKSQPAVFESKEQQIAREKQEDKMLLTLSLELDKELIRKAKVNCKTHVNN